MPFSFDNSYARLPEGFFLPSQPTPVSNPFLIRWNHELAAELGLAPAAFDPAECRDIFSGNRVPDGAEPIALAYSGHQFGGFSPLLGDGRAILLGEVIRNDGTRCDVQLKGSGQTPFSRRGDGRSALGPVLREYIVSEAMAALGVPTTRALAAVATGENVMREGLTPGGVFTRIASSHIRIGTFQWFAARRDNGNLKILADYAIDRHYPDARDSENPYVALLSNVVKRQAELVAHWMQIGFIHGVMNTDNMAISGETIDYGPCAFMDNYHPTKKFSSIDHQGRYSFGNQAPIALWNLSRFAETLLPLIDDDQDRAIAAAETALGRFEELHSSELEKRFAEKIGIRDARADDRKLAQSLLHAMSEGEADFTLVFRRLRNAFESRDDAPVVSLFNQPASILSWLKDWRTRHHDTDPDEVTAIMKQANPVFIPRNHRIEAAIEAANRGDYDLFHKLNEVLRQPFEDQPEYAEYENAPAPDEVVCATFCGT